MRRAYVEVQASMLADGLLGYLVDNGLHIEGSLASQDLSPIFGIVRLIVTGDILPAECEDTPGAHLMEVRIMFVAEHLGQQRLVRIASIATTGRGYVTTFGSAPTELQAPQRVA